MAVKAERYSIVEAFAICMQSSYDLSALQQQRKDQDLGIG